MTWACCVRAEREGLGREFPERHRAAGEAHGLVGRGQNGGRSPVALYVVANRAVSPGRSPLGGLRTEKDQAAWAVVFGLLAELNGSG